MEALQFFLFFFFCLHLNGLLKYVTTQHKEKKEEVLKQKTSLP